MSRQNRINRNVAGLIPSIEQSLSPRSAMISSEHLSLSTWADDDLTTYEANKRKPRFGKNGGTQMQFGRTPLERKSMRRSTHRSQRHIRYLSRHAVVARSVLRRRMM
ncbi:hypothetical protein HYALB_00012998 [Hymenoscyphus albidus]|uniref:Uncharacterized protein n=1 Tax=Hymenoscyphus albidus TaxID=595503 RepID=A0A9N9LSD6_9HELO|nr:hypothetical protein HYALB_00012998 [Hymenoscyphus albidus]